MIVVIARFSPQSGQEDELVALLGETQQASRGDDGCLAYGYFKEIADPSSFIAVEQWQDMKALDAHLAQPHIARLVAALPRLVAGRPDIQVHEVASSEPLRTPPGS